MSTSLSSVMAVVFLAAWLPAGVLHTAEADDGPPRAEIEEAWREMTDGSVERSCVFRVVDQFGQPVVGVPIFFSATYLRPDFLTSGQMYEGPSGDRITDAKGMMRTERIKAHRFQADVSPRIDGSSFFVPPFEFVENSFRVDYGNAGQVNAPIPVDRRQPGVDYEFRIIRYPVQPPVVTWTSTQQLPVDGQWVPWSPQIAGVQTTTSGTPPGMSDQPAPWEVSLWRDPHVPVLTFTPTTLPSGKKTFSEYPGQAPWRLAIRARRGGLVVSPWKPLVRDRRDMFPMIDTLPVDGYQPELSWDMPGDPDRGPLRWNQSFAIYWRCSERPVRIAQVIVTPFWDDVKRGIRERTDADPRHFAFGLKATFRTLVEPGPVLALDPSARPTGPDGRVPENSPHWFKVADKTFLSRLLGD